MPDPCKVCGEDPDICREQRAAFAAEPFLAPGFELGAQWTSYDDGLTWLRFPTPEQVREYVDRRGHVATMTVTAIDKKTGTVTLAVRA